jgi:hypothetical protein
MQVREHIRFLNGRSLLYNRRCFWLFASTEAGNSFRLDSVS